MGDAKVSHSPQSAEKKPDPAMTPEAPTGEQLAVPVTDALGLAFGRAAENPVQLTPQQVLYLQRAVGNRAVGRLLQRAAGDGADNHADGVVQRRVQVSPAPATVLQRDVLPVARFTPAPGITVDRNGQAVTISGTMELSGPEANAQRATQIQTCINNTWRGRFPDGSSVSCAITVRFRASGSPAGDVAQIIATRMSEPSNVRTHGARTMTLNANEGEDTWTWTPAHEFGHVIGLRDRYTEGILSKIRGRFGGERQTPAESGYERNVMGTVGGTLERSNVGDVAE